MKARLINDQERGMVEAILAMENLFPEKIGYGEWDVWDNLQNANNINVIIEDDNGRIIGYLLAIPQVEAVGYLKEEDSLLSVKDGMYHVDQVAVVEDRRNGVVFRRLIHEMIAEVKKRGGSTLSSYIMAGMSSAIEQMFKNITERRATRLPSYGDHDLIYMEAKI